MKHVNLFFNTEKIVIPNDSKCVYSSKDYIKYINHRRPLEDSDTFDFDLSLMEHNLDLLLVDFNSIYDDAYDLGFFIIQIVAIKEPTYFIMEFPATEQMLRLNREIREHGKAFDQYKTGLIYLRSTGKDSSFFYYGNKDGVSAEIFKTLFKNYTNVLEKTAKLREELLSLPFSDGTAFERFLEVFLTICFHKAYRGKVDIKTQVTNHLETDRRDFQITNKTKCKNEFLRLLKSRDNVDILLFDAKNYKNELAQAELARFRAYLDKNPYFGNFGIVLTREGITNKCKTWLRDYWKDNKVRILVLDERDLLRMLDLYKEGKDSVEVIEEKYNDMVNGI
ncbi:hypothetical protein [Paenibacillus periandrae]|uniref:hypothetical protein n=1 Tax=Paenibacillus periandrae TaxID=1761741 RepID=UPI001F08E4FA|nr:hypothetical protein [Paenibacillus periandrae]